MTAVSSTANRVRRFTGRAADAPQYDAFISYSHAADGKLAPKLQEGLQRLARPLFRPRALHVFRDETGLSVTAALWPTIQRALDRSRYFILLASPASATSKWVNEEIEHWLTQSPAAREGNATQRLLIVLTDGEIGWDPARQRFDDLPNNALGPRLHGVFAHEPLWVDLRDARTQDDLSLLNPYFRGKVADLAATIHGKSKDELIGEDVRMARRTRRLAWTASLLLAGLTATAAATAVTAVRQRDQARSRALATSAVAQLDVDPRESLDRAVRAVETAPTDEAISALRESLIRSSLIAEMVADSGRIASAEFSPRGDRIVTDVELPGGRWYLQTWSATSGARGCAAPGTELRRFTADSVGMVTTDTRVLDVLTCAPLQRDTAEGEISGLRLEIVGSPLHPQALRDVRTGRTVLDFPRDMYGLGSWTISADERWVVTFEGKGINRPVGGSEGVGTSASVWLLGETGGAEAAAETFLVGHRRAINTATFGFNAIATGSDDRTVRIWTQRSLLGWQQAAVLPGHRSAVTQVRLSPDDGRVVSVAADGTARLWWTGTGTTVHSLTEDVFAERYGLRLPVLRGAQPDGMPVLTRDGRRVVAAVDEMSIAVWDAATGARVGPVLELWPFYTAELPAPSEVKHLEERLSPDGTRILVPLGDRALLTDDSTVLVVEVATGKVVGTLHSGFAGVAAYSSDGRQIATAGSDGTVRLWNARTFAPGRVLQLPDTRALYLSFSPDGKRIVISSVDVMVRIWDPETNGLLELFGHEGGVYQGVIQAFFSPDGALVVSVGDDGVRVWDARSGKMLRQYFYDHVAWAHLSPDCGRLVVGMWAEEGAAHTLPFGACGPVERMMALARSRIRTVAAGAPARRTR